MSEQDEVFDRDPSLDERAFELQGTFRTALDCMARTGEVCRLSVTDAYEAEAKRCGVFPATLMLADMLLDSGTTFCMATAGYEYAARQIASRTHVTPAALGTAACVIVPEAFRGEDAVSAVAELAAGTLEQPHLGATTIVECSVLLGLDAQGMRVGSASHACAKSAWELSGPGVDGAAHISCDRGDVLRARVARKDEFPCGIDLMFVDGFGHIAAVPRSSVCREVELWDM